MRMKAFVNNNKWIHCARAPNNIDDFYSHLYVNMIEKKPPTPHILLLKNEERLIKKAWIGMIIFVLSEGLY